MPEFNLSPTEETVLKHLAEDSDGEFMHISAEEMSDKLDLTLGQVLHALRVLETCGLVHLAGGKDEE